MPSATARPYVWWTRPLLALGVAGLAVAVVVEIRVVPGSAADRLLPEPAWIVSASGLLQLVVGCLVRSRSSYDRFASLLGWVGTVFVLSGLVHAAGRAALTDQDVAAPLTTIQAGLVWSVDVTTAPLAIASAAFLLLFPTGAFLSGAWGIAGRFSLVVFAVGAMLVVLSAAPIEVSPDLAAEPEPAVRAIDPTTLTSAGMPWVEIVPVVMLPTYLVPLLTVVRRYRRASGEQRQHLRWLFWAVTVVALAMTVSLLVGLRLELGTWVALAAWNVPVLAMGLAMLDPAAMSVEELLTGTVVNGGLTVSLLVVDLAALSLVSNRAGGALLDGGVLVAILTASVMVYGPLRERLSSPVRRRLLGDRDRPYHVVSTLAASLERATDQEEQLGALTDALAAAFRIDYVRLTLDHPDCGTSTTGVRGEAPATVRDLPVEFRGTRLGTLTVPARGIRGPLSRRDEQLLGDLVRQAAVAFRTLQLADELQSHRQRLVGADAEERLRLRTDLHEGLHPAVEILRGQLRAAESCITRDGRRADALLGEAIARLRGLVDDVRHVAHRLRPPALDSLGLSGALRELLSRRGAATSEVVEGSDLARLSAAVEVAAYRLVDAALRSVDGVAGPVSSGRRSLDSAVVRLIRDDRELMVEVSMRPEDDDVIILADAHVGEVRERVAELGGRTEVVRSGATQVVRAWLPSEGA